MTTDELPEAPWRRPKKAAGRTRPSLSRDAIVAKALQLIDAEGVDAVSMRRVATEFGTGPASLYAYVANKDELLSAAYELALSEAAFPDTDQPWQDIVREFAWNTYRLYARHRDLARLSFADIPTGARTLDGVERMLKAFLDQGVDAKDATWMFDRLALYIAADAFEGYVLSERFKGTDKASTEEAGVEWIAEVRDYFAQLPADRYPMIKANLGVMMSGDGEERFRYGVELLIDGVEARNPASVNRASAKKRSKPRKK